MSIEDAIAIATMLDLSADACTKEQSALRITLRLGATTIRELHARPAEVDRSCAVVMEMMRSGHTMLVRAGVRDGTTLSLYRALTLSIPAPIQCHENERGGKMYVIGDNGSTH